MFLVYVVLCLIVFGCHYQCNQLPGKTRLRNDLLCLECDVKAYTLTHLAVKDTDVGDGGRRNTTRTTYMEVD